MTDNIREPSTAEASSPTSSHIATAALASIPFDHVVTHILDGADATTVPWQPPSVYLRMAQIALISERVGHDLRSAVPRCGYVDPSVMSRARRCLGTIEVGQTHIGSLNLSIEESEMAEQMFLRRMSLEALFTESEQNHRCTCSSGERTPTAESFAHDHGNSRQVDQYQSLEDMVRVWYEEDRQRGEKRGAEEGAPDSK